MDFNFDLTSSRLVYLTMHLMMIRARWHILFEDSFKGGHFVSTMDLMVPQIPL